MAFVEAFTGGNDAGTSTATTTPNLVMAGGGTESVGDIPINFWSINSNTITLNSTTLGGTIQSGPDVAGTALGAYITELTTGLTSGQISTGTFSGTWSSGARQVAGGILLRGRAASGNIIGTPFTSGSAGSTVTLPSLTSVPAAADLVGAIMVRSSTTTAITAVQADLTGAGFTIGRALATNYGSGAQFTLVTFYQANVSAGNYGGQTINLSASSANKIAELIAVPVSTGSVATFTSANNTTFTELTPGTFTVTTTGGSPTPVLTKTGSLPTGVTFTDNTDGTATIAGTPAAATVGSYPITITATNASGAPTQAFTLTVNGTAATFTSATSTSFQEHVAGTFSVTTTGGSPTPVLTKTGSLPSGVTFTDNANGTATIAGTSALGTVGAYPITITATNSAGAPTQSFTLNITTFVPAAASETLVHALNRVAGTTGLEVAGAANAWAGTTGLEIIGALNAKAGTSGSELLKVLNALAGTTGLDEEGAARNLH